MSAVPQIVEWANKQLLPWQRDAVRRLLTQAELTDIDRAELLNMAKAAANLPVTGAVPAPKAPEAGEVPGAPAESTAVVLQAIEGVTNVNLIADGARLPFAHNGLTIIYGQNGAGKSGFARVLKRACRARDKDEPIRPNVFVDSNGAIPSAKIRMTVNGNPDQLFDWQEGAVPMGVLANISVFDARCARLIVDNKKNELHYLPYGADVFEKLAALVTWIQETLRAEKPAVPTLGDSSIGADTNAGIWLAALSNNTNDAELEKVATWTPEREQTILEAKKQMALLEAGDTTKEIDRLVLIVQRLTALKTKAAAIAQALNGDVEKKVMSAINDLIEKQRASAIIAAEAAKAEPLPGVGTSSAWKTLYDAAKAFAIDAYPGKPFPNVEADARCVLCLQPVMDEAKERFVRFRKFMESAVENELVKTRQTITAVRREVSDCVIPAHDTYAAVIEDAKPFDAGLDETVKRVFSAYEQRKQQLLANIDNLTWVAMADGPGDITSAIDVVVKIVTDRTQSLREASKPEEIKKLRIHIREEVAWQALAQRHTDVRARRDALALEARYVAAHKSLRPTGITVAGRGIVDAALTPALIDALASELTALGWGANTIDIKPEGRDGATRIQFQLGEAKAIGNARLSDILSEGEQRALAIAGFMAEVKISGHRQPIVFDDPVSSLDHVFTRNVAARLAKEALERQVIVFTHDLALLVELSEAAEEMALRGSPVASQVITVSRLALPGVATVGHPWEGATTKERANHLVEMLAKIKPLQQSDKAAYNREAAQLYSRLRETWEGLVERDLFGAVVTRYRLDVQTSTLWEVQVEDSDVYRIDAAMTKASRFMVGHNTSLHISADRPDPDAIAADIEELRLYAKQLIQRREKLKKTRKQAVQPAAALVG